MQKLTVVVNCTDRKSVAPTDTLRARSLPPGATSDRSVEWRQRVVAAEPSVHLQNLYRGDAWVQAKGLASDAANRGTAVRLLVASAGLGLRDVTQLAPPYAATFASGHDDSVTTDPNELTHWWYQLAKLPNTVAVAELARESVLFVLSESYARAMDADLTSLATNGGDYLLVGGWRKIDGLARLPADRELRQKLGGTVSTINLRMARRWMAERRSDQLHAEDDSRRWARWAGRARRSETYERTPMTDSEIRQVIGVLIQVHSVSSATRALRLLRDQGIACEQKRFGALFREVVDAQ